MQLTGSKQALKVSSWKLHADGPETKQDIESLKYQRRKLMLRQAGELAGLQLSGACGCAHSLIDKVTLIQEDDLICYLVVDEFERQEQETQDDGRSEN